MRKKSHISLACYIVRNTDCGELKKHRLAFYLGSILPDIKPSFLYKKHEIDGTFEDVREAIGQLARTRSMENARTSYYRMLGQVTHYLADYFTFPHNSSYPGSLKDHCFYEELLKKNLRAYLKSDFAEEHLQELLYLSSPEEIGEFILERHKQYLESAKNISLDIHSIVHVNFQTVNAILMAS